MICVRKGDLDGLIDLFDRGLASPQDCNDHGDTIFNVSPIEIMSRIGVQVDQNKVACVLSHTHIVNYFIDMNLDIMSTTAMGIATVFAVFEGTMPIDIIRQLSSRGFFNSLANATEDFELYNETVEWNGAHIFSAFGLVLASRRQELFELCLRAYFPCWYDLPPRLKQEILILGVLFVGCTADGLRRIICPDGPIRPIDTKAWNNDGASLLHVLFHYYLLRNFVTDSEDFKSLLEEAIRATDDVHYVYHGFHPKTFLLEEAEGVSALRGALSLLPIVTDISLKVWTVHGKLSGMTVALQSLMSVLATCGHDLLDFGRKEADIWASECDTRRTMGDWLYLGIRYNKIREIRAVHYGAEPKDWYFEMDYHYEEYAGVFWNLIENPHVFMIPGSWVDEE